MTSVLPARGADATERLLDALAAHGSVVRGGDNHWMASCPAHEDRTPSLSVHRTRGRVLVFDHGGCSADAIVDALGLSLADLYDDRRGVDYSYWHAGRLVRRVHRSPEKRFTQDVLDPSVVPLYVPLGVDLAAAVADGRDVYVPEGEQDADTLAQEGVVAVSAPMGAASWAKADYSPLKGSSDLYVLADNDEPGMRRAQDLARFLATLTSGSVSILRAAVGKDVTDHIVAGRSLGELVPVALEAASDDRTGGDLYVDVAALLSRGDEGRPVPSIGRRSDGVRLFYPGKVNVVFGQPESGKTLLLAYVSAQALVDGGRVLWLDLDHNGAGAIVGRLLELGAPQERLVDQRWFRLSVPDDADDVRMVVVDSAGWAASVAVVDSVGELLPLFGGNSNDSDDFTLVNRDVLEAFASSGAAVLAVDHEAKSRDSAARGATGTAAKKRALSGAMLRMVMVQPFVRDRSGSATLRIVKDRPGALREVAAAGEREPNIAVFDLSDDGFALRVPVGSTSPDARVAADALALESLSPGPRSTRDVKERMGWGSDRALAAWKAWNSGVPGSGGTAGNEDQAV